MAFNERKGLIDIDSQLGVVVWPTEILLVPDVASVVTYGYRTHLCRGLDM
jgi:hypothetical protein